MRIHLLPSALMVSALGLSAAFSAPTAAGASFESDPYGKAGSHEYEQQIGWRHVEYFGGMRVSGGIAPGIRQREVQGVKTTLDPAYGSQFSIGTFYDTSMLGGWGFAATPALTFRQVTGSTTIAGVYTRDEIKSYDLRIGIGPSFTVGPVNLELTPFVGAGEDWNRFESSTPTTSVRQTSGAGIIYDYGAMLNAHYLCEDNLLLGLTVGYDAFHTRVKFHPGTTETLDGDGLMAEAVIGLWF